MSDADFDAGGTAGKDRNFVTALARGLDVLRCFRHGEVCLTNTDFSERTGLPKPTVSRLTYTLCQLGFLVQDRQSGAYRLGVGVLRLGFSVLAGMDICERAGDVLRALRSSGNSYITAALAEAHRSDVIYIAVRPSREDVSLRMHVGSRLPLFHSATGRAILAGMTPDNREAAIAAGVEDLNVRESELRAELEQAISSFERHGYCTGYGDWRADVNGIAVPVASENGRRVYGLNVGGPSFHVSPQELESKFAPLLVDAANTLSLAS